MENVRIIGILLIQKSKYLSKSLFNLLHQHPGDQCAIQKQILAGKIFVLQILFSINMNLPLIVTPLFYLL